MLWSKHTAKAEMRMYDTTHNTIQCSRMCRNVQKCTQASILVRNEHGHCLHDCMLQIEHLSDLTKVFWSWPRELHRERWLFWHQMAKISNVYDEQQDAGLGTLQSSTTNKHTIVPIVGFEPTSMSMQLHWNRSTFELYGFFGGLW